MTVDEFVLRPLLLVLSGMPVTTRVALLLGRGPVVAHGRVHLRVAPLRTGIGAVLLSPLLMAGGIAVRNLENDLAHRWDGIERCSESDC